MILLYLSYINGFLKGAFPNTDNQEQAVIETVEEDSNESTK